MTCLRDVCTRARRAVRVEDRPEAAGRRRERRAGGGGRRFGWKIAPKPRDDDASAARGGCRLSFGRTPSRQLCQRAGRRARRGAATNRIARTVATRWRRRGATAGVMVQGHGMRREGAPPVGPCDEGDETQRERGCKTGRRGRCRRRQSEGKGERERERERERDGPRTCRYSRSVASATAGTVIAPPPMPKSPVRNPLATPTCTASRDAVVESR